MFRLSGYVYPWDPGISANHRELPLRVQGFAFEYLEKVSCGLFPEMRPLRGTNNEDRRIQQYIREYDLRKISKARVSGSYSGGQSLRPQLFSGQTGKPFWGHRLKGQPWKRSSRNSVRKGDLRLYVVNQRMKEN